MNVLTITAIYPNEINDVEGRSVACLNRELTKLGVHTFTIVLRPWLPRFISRRIKKWQHLAVKSRKEDLDGRIVIFNRYIHIPWRWRLDLSARSMALRAKQLVEKHSLRFDLIHGQSIYPSAIAASLLSGQYRAPFILTLRDDLSHLDDILESGNTILRNLYWDVFSNVDAIFAHGPSIIRDLPKFLSGNRSIPVVMAPNGVDIETVDKIIEDSGANEVDFKGSIISVSNLYRFKGVHENLYALRRLVDRGKKGWRYVVVGDGPYRRELADLSKKLDLASRVSFLGRLSYPETIRQIRNADIFALPSWAEPFGNVYAEAAACSKPVIGCKGYGAEVVVKHGETGILVPPRDVDSLADALEYLLENPEKAREMGKRGREHIRQFTWERTAQLYKDKIEEIVSASRTRYS